MCVCIRVCVCVLPCLVAQLRLVEAFREYDAVFALSRRKYIPPNFAELRHIVNIAQVGRGMWGGGLGGGQAWRVRGVMEVRGHGGYVQRGIRVQQVVSGTTRWVE